jgi:heat-inducible transcriptional repressor
MITQRQSEMLKIIVEEYIKTIKPVGSKSICDVLDCSSATIRNDMAELEELGFLEKTHISSGRIPSEQGYRYYVNNLMEPKKMTGEEVLKLQTIFRNRELELSDVINKSMEIISEITAYTSIVLGNSSSLNKLKRVEAVPINDNNIIAIVITDKGHVENKTIELSNSISIDEIKKTVDLINNLLVGTPIDEISEKLEFEIKPIIAKYVKQHEMIYNAFYNVFNEFTQKTSNFHFSGKTNILKQPEFDDTNKIRKIIDKFEDKHLVNDIVETNNGINIYIGAESKIDEDVTIIKTKYSVNGEEGTIAIIGPKRMEYDKVVGLLEYIKEKIEG